MSPEQAAMSSQDADTRTAIYALGVLLYELLTSTTPFDKERFRAPVAAAIVRYLSIIDHDWPSRLE
jgi:eukaryotic-like serine/threonine-protein kinase